MRHVGRVHGWCLFLALNFWKFWTKIWPGQSKKNCRRVKALTLEAIWSRARFPPPARLALWRTCIRRLPGYVAGWQWPAGFVAGWVCGWLAMWLIGYMAGWFCEWLLAGCVPLRLCGWLAGWLAMWLPM